MIPALPRGLAQRAEAAIRHLREAWQQLRSDSLAARLFMASALWTMIVLPITGMLLNSLYRSEVEREYENRLDVALTALTALSWDAGATAPEDPKDFGDEVFKLPLSGWYWQIGPADGQPGKRVTSPSLLDGTLTFPEAVSQPASDPRYRIARGTGPNDIPVIMLQRNLTFGTAAAARPYSYIVTARLSEIDQAVAGFRNRLALALTVLGIGLVAATLFQVRYGLRPLGAIGKGLADIRSGKAARLEGELPAEIIPLQDELNALIKSNQDIVERARTHVGNLAHALKTPLSVITNEAGRDQSPLARKVIEQANIMRDQVNHHLDRARMVARIGMVAGVTEVEPVGRALVRTLQRINSDRGVTLSLDCPEGLRFQGERQDLEEMLGNLLDNACKWSKGRVRLLIRPAAGKGTRAPKQILLAVEDDGPGIPESERAAAVKRGRRLDESKPGSGLGLSIVADLVGLYGGSFDLGRSEWGGLRAELRLPAA